jgi:hypothetical protein
MAVVFSKVGNNGLNITWTSGDLETCGNVTYRYLYRLYKDNSLYQTTSYQSTIGFSWINLPAGVYYVEVDTEFFEPDEMIWSLCNTHTTGNVTITWCIPNNATNVSMQRLADFYGISTSNILLSGPNDPSTAGSVFGASDLPTSGSPSKLRPNAISELFNTCGGVIPWYEVVVVWTGSSLTNACDSAGIGAGTTYYMDTPSLNTTTGLWTNTSLTTWVADGFYSNGSHAVRVLDSSIVSRSTCVF